MKRHGTILIFSEVESTHFLSSNNNKRDPIIVEGTQTQFKAIVVAGCSSGKESSAETSLCAKESGTTFLQRKAEGQTNHQNLFRSKNASPVDAVLVARYPGSIVVGY